MSADAKRLREASTALPSDPSAQRRRGGDIRNYDLYGVVLRTDYRFATPLPQAPEGATPDVVFTCSTTATVDVDWRSGRRIDAQGLREDGEPDFLFVRFPSHDTVRITGALDFHVFDDRITCHLLDDRHEYLVDIAFLGMVLAFGLERRGTPTLHASVATVDGRAVGFLGNKGGGKTSTLAACMARGHALLTDDLLALRQSDGTFCVERGFPALRLWPAQAEHFVGEHEDLPAVHPDFPKKRIPIGTGRFGTFAGGAAPLQRLYLPERVHGAADEIYLEPLSAAEAVMQLLRHSFLPREVHRFGWQPQRLQVFSRLVGSVDVVRMRYPSGFDLLPDAVARLEEDLRHEQRA
jgi:hypothetical protein